MSLPIALPFSLNTYQSEALVFCLAASLVWAPLIYLGARLLDREQRLATGERIWIGALIAAILPALSAPTLAWLGLSLRAQPEPLAPLILPETMSFTPSASAMTAIEPVAAPAFTMAQAISMAGMIYVYGALLAFSLILVRTLAFRCAAAAARPVADSDLIERVDAWRIRLGLRRLPEIRRSRQVSSACVSGLFRPIILIPVELGERVSQDEIVMMCAHELAHLRRGDVRLFSAASLARGLFWFNPFVGRIAKRIEIAAEEGADALVLARGADRRAYAACFVQGLKFAAEKAAARPIAALAFTPIDRAGRRRRLDSILSGKERAPLSAKSRLALGTAGVVATMLAVGQAAYAVDPASAGERAPVFRLMPVEGRITMGFGEKAKVLGPDRPTHEGVDIAAPRGTAVNAPADGVVIAATDRFNDSSAYGKVIAIDHGAGLVTRFAHLDEIGVKPGQKVKAGEVIGKVGSTCQSKGPHLHFEALQDGAHVDPMKIIKKAELIGPAPLRLASSDKAAPKKKNSVAPDANIVIDGAPIVVDGKLVEPAPRSDATSAEPEYPSEPATVARALAAPTPDAQPFVVAQAEVVHPSASPSAQQPQPIAPRGLSTIKGAPDLTGLNVAAAPGATFMNPAVIADLENALLGRAPVSGLSYKLAFNDGDEKFIFESGERLTDEEKIALKKALKQMRKDMAKLQKEQARVIAELSRDGSFEAAVEASALAGEFAEDFGMEFGSEFGREFGEKFNDQFGAEFGEFWSGEFNERLSNSLDEMKLAGNLRGMTDEERQQLREELRRAGDEAREARREAFADREEALRDQLDHLREAQREMREHQREHRNDLRDALRDIEDVRRDIDDEEMSSTERRETQRALDRARAQIERQAQSEERSLANALNKLEQKEQEIERLRKELAKEKN